MYMTNGDIIHRIRYAYLLIAHDLVGLSKSLIFATKTINIRYHGNRVVFSSNGLRIIPTISKSNVTPLGVVTGHLQYRTNGQTKYGGDWPSHITGFHRMGIFTLKMTEFWPNDMEFVKNDVWNPHQTLVISWGDINLVIYQNTRVGYRCISMIT